MPAIDCRLRCAWSLVAAAGLVACASGPPEPWYRQKTLEATATVVAIDAEARLVALRAADGVVTTVYVGPEIRNFEQIQVDDRVVVTYHAALAAAATTPEQATDGAGHSVAVRRAEPGERPHGSVAESMTATVQIDSIDAAANTVTFHGEDGLVRTTAVEDAEARKFIRGLHRGDFVKLTYAEAITVSVQPAAPDDGR